MPLQAIRSSSDAYRGARVALVTGGPGELELDSSRAYRVAVHTGKPHHLWEWREGRSQNGSHQRGDVAVTSVGESRRVRWDRPTELVSIELMPELVHETATSLEVDLAQAAVVGSFSQPDPMLERLAFALVAELENGLASGSLFGDAVVTTMAAHLVREYGRRGVRSSAGRRGGLAPRTLASVVEYVHASLAERIALADLAKVAKLSAYHFAREFQLCTGLPPHAYVVRERVNRAIGLILDGARISEAAASVGFSSQGHLTRHMRKVAGVTPGALVANRRPSKRI